MTSIVGRFLEHSRLWYFANGTTPEYYIGSADWMPRNLDRRVEAVTPVEDVALDARLSTFLQTCLTDNRRAWELSENGAYRQRAPGDEPERSAQDILQRDPWGRIPDAPRAPVLTHSREHASAGG